MGVLLLLALSVAVQAGQPRLVLGDTARVTLQISAAGARPDARVELWTSAGRVVDVQRVSAESFSAVYLPPSQHYPQVAIILATVRDGEVTERGWLALPLIAHEKLPVQTKPSSRVELSIAGITYGPVRTDASGNARILARIPPGSRTATIRVRDPFGNLNETSFDLRPPPFPRLRMIALGDRASWADVDPVRLEIFAVAPDGRPAAAADLSVVADRGQVGVPQERRPGVFDVWFRAPDRAGGVAKIRARVSGDREGETATIALLPGPVARIPLTAIPASIAGAGEVRIAAEVLDAHGNPVSADDLRFAVDGAALEQEGTSARLLVAADHAGKRELTVTATARTIRGSVAVPLRAGAPAQASVVLPDGQVREGESTEALVELRDAGGNPVGGAALDVGADGARVETPREVREGVYAVRVHTRRGDAPGPAELRVRAGDARQTARIGIVRDERENGISLGALLGGQSNFSRANGGSMQLEVAVHPGLRDLEAVARVGMLQFAPAHASLTDVPMKGDLRGLSLAAGVRGSLMLRGRFAAHGALLAGALRSYGSVAIDGGPAAGLTQGMAQWGPLLTATAGASMRAGSGRVLAELQLSHAPVKGDVTGNLGGLGVSVGYLFTLR
jgi:hypothetical protein